MLTVENIKGWVNGENELGTDSERELKFLCINFLLDKVEQLRADIHTNGNRAIKIQAEEYLATRKATAEKCCELIFANAVRHANEDVRVGMAEAAFVLRKYYGLLKTQIKNEIDCLKDEAKSLIEDNSAFGDPPEFTLDVENRLEEIRSEIAELEEKLENV